MTKSLADALGASFVDNGGRELIVKATIKEIETFNSVEELLKILEKAAKPVEQELRKAYENAGVDPVGANDKPRMLKLTAFIAHGGSKPNLNNDGFSTEDLFEAVNNGLFAPPYFGMIDFNHDFNAYGAWYSSKFEFDPLANENGILAEGAIFAWRYEELADKMIAMQQRQGHIDVSMACLPAWTERHTTQDGQSFTLLRKPVFFTTSVLDVDPADPTARAIGTEDIAETPADREILIKKSTKMEIQPDLTEVSSINLEDSMQIQELIESFRQVVAEENRAQFDEIVKSALKLPEVQAALDAAVATAQEKVTQLAELTTEKATLEVKLQEADVLKSTLETKITEQTTELDALRAYKAEKEAAELAVARKAQQDVRLAELSKAAKDALDAKPEEVRTKIVDRWTDCEQAEWEVILASMNATETKGKYEAASDKEGTLATGGSALAAGEDAVDKFLTKKK